MKDKGASSCNLAALGPAIFRALCEPSRLMLLNGMMEDSKPRSVSEIAEAFGSCLDMSVVSRHLRALREAGVVEGVRRGKEVFYRVKSEELVSVLRGLADSIERAGKKSP